MITGTSFRQAITDFAASGRIIVDRPQGAKHLCYSDLIYPLDYGYLENTSGEDGDGIGV